MGAEDQLRSGVGAPGPEDRANGAALLAAALAREAEVLARAAGGLRAVLDLFPPDARGPEVEDRRVLREGLKEGAALAGALLVASRQLLRESDPAEAARASVGRMPRGTLSAEEVMGHVRAAALLPLTDDGVARVSAAMVAAAFCAEFRVAWQRAKG